MDALLLFFGEGSTFDADKVQHDLEDVVGTSEMNADHFSDSVVGCRYDFNGDTTTVRLDDPETISIDGTGEASLQMALELQRREARPLHVTNLGYDFDFTLTGVGNLKELTEKVRAANRQEVSAA